MTRTPAKGEHTAPMPEAKLVLQGQRGTLASAGKQSPRSKDGKVHVASDSGEPMIHETDHPRH